MGVLGGVGSGCARSAGACRRRAVRWQSRRRLVRGTPSAWLIAAVVVALPADATRAAVTAGESAVGRAGDRHPAGCARARRRADRRAAWRLLGRRPQQLHAWCWRRRAYPRSRSATGRSSRRRWPGSGAGCSAGGSPTCCWSGAGGRSPWRAAVPGAARRTVASMLTRQRRLVARSARAARAGARVRGLDGDVQRDLPTAGRGRRPAHQRRRRHGHRVAGRACHAGRGAPSRAVPGVQAVEPLQHRFAYVGNRPAGPLRRRPGHDRRGRPRCRTPTSRARTAARRWPA